jgi:hypothetical protein
MVREDATQALYFPKIMLAQGPKTYVRVRTYINPKANMAKTPSLFFQLNLNPNTAVIGMLKMNKSKARPRDAKGTDISKAVELCDMEKNMFHSVNAEMYRPQVNIRPM